MGELSQKLPNMHTTGTDIHTAIHIQLERDLESLSSRSLRRLKNYSDGRK